MATERPPAEVREGFEHDAIRNARPKHPRNLTRERRE
jgi:hypothetical protein